MADYIVIKERGVKGVDGNTWRFFEYVVPSSFNNEVTLPEEVLISSGKSVIQVTLNGLTQDDDHYTLSGTTLTWSHPYLTLLEGEVLKIWYIPKH